ncbi:MAG: DUF5719 family protein [Actinomycetaceae bacterium]|nr:DUF5719 family protein [Actinomycetaceae bacterium]
MNKEPIEQEIPDLQVSDADEAPSSEPHQSSQKGPAHFLRITGKVALSAFSAVMLISLGIAVVLADALVPKVTAGSIRISHMDLPATAVNLACPQMPDHTNREGMSIDGLDTPPVVSASTTVAVMSSSGSLPKGVSFLDADGNSMELSPRAGLIQGSYPSAHIGYLHAPPNDDATALGGAVVEQSVNTGDYRGLASSGCLAPSMDSWLVGGSTSAGVTSTLRILNPLERRVEVSVAAWGSTGPLNISRGSNVAIAPGQVLSIPMEAVVANEPRIVIRVTSNGGGVVATMVAHRLDGVVPMGVDLIVPSAPPSQTLTIPGVSFDGSEGYLRLLNPSMQPVTASVWVLGPRGKEALGGAEQLILDPGAVFDISLTGLEQGNYGLVVQGSGDIIGAAQVFRQAGASESGMSRQAQDFAWIPSAEIGDTWALVGPQGLRRTLVFTNPNPNSVTASYGTQTIEVPGESTAALTLENAELGMRLKAPGMGVAQVLTTDLLGGEGISLANPTPDSSKNNTVRVQIGT